MLVPTLNRNEPSLAQASFGVPLPEPARIRMPVESQAERADGVAVSSETTRTLIVREADPCFCGADGPTGVAATVVLAQRGFRVRLFRISGVGRVSGQ